jgi:peroxiredoxin
VKKTFSRLAIVLTIFALVSSSDFAWLTGFPLARAAAVLQLAPGFTLADLKGHKIDLAAYRGQVVLLNFWATWCAPCREETPEFIRLQNEYRSRRLQVIGLSLDDDPKPVLEFYRRFKINYPVAIGDAALAERFGGILGLPVTFLIGCDGRIHSKYSGKVDIARVEQELSQLLKAQSCVGEKPKE